MDNKHWSATTALEQIDKCDFECEAGPLANNVAYKWLKDAAKVGPEFWPGQGVWKQVAAEVGGVKLTGWHHYYIGSKDYRVETLPPQGVAKALAQGC